MRFSPLLSSHARQLGSLSGVLWIHRNRNPRTWLSLGDVPGLLGEVDRGLPPSTSTCLSGVPAFVLPSSLASIAAMAASSSPNVRAYSPSDGVPRTRAASRSPSLPSERMPASNALRARVLTFAGSRLFASYGPSWRTRSTPSAMFGAVASQDSCFPRQRERSPSVACARTRATRRAPRPTAGRRTTSHRRGLRGQAIRPSPSPADAFGTPRIRSPGAHSARRRRAAPPPVRTPVAAERQPTTIVCCVPAVRIRGCAVARPWSSSRPRTYLSLGTPARAAGDAAALTTATCRPPRRTSGPAAR